MSLTDSPLEGRELPAKAGALSGGNTKPFPGPPEEPREDDGDGPEDSGQGGRGCVHLLRKKKIVLTKVIKAGLRCASNLGTLSYQLPVLSLRCGCYNPLSLPLANRETFFSFASLIDNII